ncbi:MAG: type II secretion system protein [Pyrinomonadaceae bacterium]
MTGKSIADCGLRIADFRARSARLRSRAGIFSPSNPQSAISNQQSRGFTLLELMIVISIIIILAIIVMPQYQRTVVTARESVLKDDLFQMRKMLDQYAADKGQLPQSLNDLVAAGYLREMPVDPITEKADWNTTTGADPSSAEGGQGVTDVHSSASDVSSEGTPYNQW